MNNQLMNVSVSRQDVGTLIADGTIFGVPATFSRFARAFDLTKGQFQFRQMVVVSPLMWTTDDVRAEWTDLGWMQVIVHPWPTNLMKIRIVRRLWAQGDVVFLSRAEASANLPSKVCGGER